MENDWHQYRPMLEPTLMEYALPLVGAERYMKRTETIPYLGKQDDAIANGIESGIGKLTLAHSAEIIGVAALVFVARRFFRRR